MNGVEGSARWIQWLRETVEVGQQRCPEMNDGGRRRQRRVARAARCNGSVRRRRQKKLVVETERDGAGGDGEDRCRRRGR